MQIPLSEIQQEFLFDLFQILRKAPLSAHGRYRTFEAAAGDLLPWRIESITAAALEKLVSARNAKGLRRGHRIERKQRAENMFNVSTTMSKKEMLIYFYRNDDVTLVTAKENALDGTGHWSEQIPVPVDRLKGGSYSVYATKADIAWAAQALANHLAGKA